MPALLLVLPCDAEVDEMNAAVRPGYDILRLDISVDDGRRLPVQVAENIRQLARNAVYILCRKAAFFGYDLVQRASFRIFPDKIAFPVFLQEKSTFGTPGWSSRPSSFASSSASSSG